MNISIFGMGYVGVVSAACLVRDGHHVTGIDPVESKVADLKQGHTPIQEPGVAQLLSDGFKAGHHGRPFVHNTIHLGNRGSDLI